MNLQLCLRRKWRHHAAEEQLLRVVDHETAVVDRSSRIHAAPEFESRSEACLRTHVDEIGQLLLFAEIRGLRHDIVQAAESCGDDVIQTADLVPTSTWE